MEMKILDAFQATNGHFLFLNEDKKIVGSIIHRCLQNEGYCPCGTERDEDHVCPCKEARSYAECHCNLYKRLSIDE